jgi:perosamine synthetase
MDKISSRIKDVLTSGWLTTGKYTIELEEKLADFLGVANVVAVNSCTAAIHAMLLAGDIGPGDEVIIPSNTFSATANAVFAVGAKPVFVDCRSDTFNIDVREVNRAVTHRTAAVIGVNIGGVPCDLRELEDFADARGLKFFQDAAHSLGSSYHGSEPAHYGTASAFSLSATKIITAGEGGFVALNNDSSEAADVIRAIRNNGRSKSGYSEVERIGHNFKLPDVSAVIALSQLDHLEEFLAKRQEIAKAYDQALDEVWFTQEQEVPAGVGSSYYAYLCMLDSRIDRSSVMDYLKNKGVETSIYFRPLHQMKAYHSWATLPVSEHLGQQVIGLPMGNSMSVADVQVVVDLLREAGDRRPT